MFREFAYTAGTTLTLVAAMVLTPALSADKAPMPQTKGMQGMDPAQHDQEAKDPYEGCMPNPDKAAQQKDHPMPETRGMKGMDPKTHTVDCPAGYIRKDDARHVHKAPGG